MKINIYFHIVSGQSKRKLLKIIIVIFQSSLFSEVHFSFISVHNSDQITAVHNCITSC